MVRTQKKIAGHLVHTDIRIREPTVKMLYYFNDILHRLFHANVILCLANLIHDFKPQTKPWYAHSQFP